MVPQLLGHASGNRLRLAIVGLGKMGRLHLRTWRRFSQVAITALVDTNFDRAACAVAHNLPFLRCAEELYGRVDAAIIATPSSEHVGCAVTLLRAGIHCLVEKPLAIDYVQSERLVAIAARHEAVLAVGHSERFNRGVCYARKAMTTDIRRIEVFRMGTPVNNRAADGDVVQDLMIHDLDWVIDGLRELPDECRIRSSRWHLGALAYVSCELRFSGGRSIGLTASSMAAVRLRQIHLYRPDGAVKVVNLDSPPSPEGEDPLTLQADAFLSAVGGKASWVAVGADALAAIALSDKIRALCEDTAGLVA